MVGIAAAPAWKNWGDACTLKANSLVLHSRADDVIPFADSQQLVRQSGIHEETLIEIGSDHRLADPEPLAAMLAACQRLVEDSAS